MSSDCHATIPLPAEQKSVLKTPSAIDSCVTNFETENRLEQFFAGPEWARKKRYRGKFSDGYVLLNHIKENKIGVCECVCSMKLCLLKS